jgi:hypothetical protein
MNLGNLNRKSGFFEQLSILSGHHPIHFCKSHKKETGVFFIIDCTNSLQRKIPFPKQPCCRAETSDLSVPFIEHASFPNWETVQ